MFLAHLRGAGCGHPLYEEYIGGVTRLKIRQPSRK
jgi:hypothetical protein